MTDDQHTEDETGALQVACDTAVSGCAFLMRTEEGDEERLLEVAQEHVREQHGADYSLEEIEERYVEEVDVERGTAG